MPLSIDSNKLVNEAPTNNLAIVNGKTKTLQSVTLKLYTSIEYLVHHYHMKKVMMMMMMTLATVVTW